MEDLLHDDEMARWVAWKRASEAVMAAVAAEITAETGLSSADFSVLTRVVEEAGGTIRQQRLSDALGWERSRLSRQLVRMEGRDLVRREGSAVERRIAATKAGREVVAVARRVHAGAVRRALVERTPGVGSPFWRTIEELGSTDG